MTTDVLGNCSINASHDAYPPDADKDRDADVGDLIGLFFGVIGNQANYSARADANHDDDNDVGDLLTLFFGRMLTKCTILTFTNNTGGAVDDIHIVWGSPIAEVFSARDSGPQGWPLRTLSADGLTLDMERLDAAGDLASGGQLTIAVRGTNPIVSSCRWTLDGVDKGAC